MIQEAHEALPRGAYVMRCGHGGLRPWDAVAVRRRRAGGVLQRGGPKGQQSFVRAACVVCVGSWECSFDVFPFVYTS